MSSRCDFFTPVRSLRCVLVAVLVVAIGPAAHTEVIIERTLPQTGVNTSEADWKEPPVVDPSPRTGIRPEATQRLTGRLMLGGYGSGGGARGFAVQDWSTDSVLRYSRLLGGNGVLVAGAEALRRDRIDSSAERYGGSVSWNADALRVEASGLYDRHTATTFDGTTDETTSELGIDLATKTGALLPVAFSYASEWNRLRATGGEETGARERRDETHSAGLSADIPVGVATLEADGYFDLAHDRIESTSTLGYGGTLEFMLPVTEVVSLYLASNPAYSSTERQESDSVTKEVAVENGGGVRIELDELVEGELHAGRIDAWRSDPQIADGAFVHSSVWKGRTSWSLTAPAPLTTGASYGVSLTGGSAVGHDVSASSVWKQDDGLLKEAQLRGRLAISEATDLTAEHRREEWSTGVTLAPTERAELSASYVGSRRHGESVAWSHTAAGTYSHTPAQVFGYGLGGSYRYMLEDSSAAHRYSGSGNVGLRPRIGHAQWELAASELFELERSSGADDVLSTSTVSLAVPVLKQLSLRYMFTWEWTDAASTNAPEGSAFSHNPGLTVSGPGLPFRLTSSYLMGHGYRGTQHHADVAVRVGVAESFSLISELNYRYAETIDYETPFRFTTLLHYEF
jgi:hypothetical protein